MAPKDDKPRDNDHELKATVAAFIAAADQLEEARSAVRAAEALKQQKLAAFEELQRPDVWGLVWDGFRSRTLVLPDGRVLRVEYSSALFGGDKNRVDVTIVDAERV